MATTSDDEYEIPLRDQRYFGAGIKRKRILFVASTSDEAILTPTRPATTTTTTAADRYLAIVLKTPKVDALTADHAVGGEVAGDQLKTDDPTCNICHRPMTAEDTTQSHSTSIAHQICLQHSHPPSHVDRTRKGLAVLENQGWDPDSRLGLGAAGEGRLYPVRATENPNKAGLGARFAKPKPIEKPIRLDAGKTRLMEQEGKKTAERLRNAFQRSEEVEKYLSGEQANHILDLAAFRRAKTRR
ncbi:hypothetical protein LTR78_009957 [Recurvomyces mirabilis]|uniref:G-patch domain-containing protein n=1 Tax=Recurvomyces mirabilis TaxID=574656 RepID=A0AAE0TT19_9PEZI|nr:hypothetical protein LTR78_009957 [Recurvomyces mirabilis]KAK5160389.1 hypothetical protein LTS14_001401 [Recurvomyces mirabilis]